MQIQRFRIFWIDIFEIFLIMSVDYYLSAH